MTNETIKKCATCGTSVLHSTARTIHFDMEVPDKHNAPCGAPCLGGGVDPKTYRAGVHGGRKSCPACKPEEKR